MGPMNENKKEKRPTKEISAGIIVFRRTDEGLKFLILYHGGDYWNFPKGKLEGDERSWQTAFREVREETGLKKCELTRAGNFKTFEKFHFRRGREKVYKIVILYLAETTQKKIVISSNEHSGYGWFRLADAKKIMAKHKESANILRKASLYLRNQEKRRSEK